VVAVLAAAATSAAVFLRRHRRKRQTQCDTIDDCWHDSSVIEHSSVGATSDSAREQARQTTGQQESAEIRATTELSSSTQHDHHHHYSSHERQRALAHVKARVARLRAIHEAEHLEHHHTPAYVTRHSSDLSPPPSPTYSPIRPPIAEITTTMHHLPPKLLTIVSRNELPQDDEEHCKSSSDGTEATQESDFCSTSSLGSSNSSLESYYSAPRASYPGLCHEVLTLVGFIAGATALTFVDI